MLTIWIMSLLVPLLLEVDCHGGDQHHGSPFLPKSKAMSFIPENHWLNRRDANLCRDDEEYCERSPVICRQYVEPSREEACRETPCSSGYTCYLEVPCRAHFRTGCRDVACINKACKNGASCHHITGSNVKCHCTHGYYGDVCEFVDSCLAAPCLNGGSCNRNASSFDCSCSNRYTGSTCETDCRPGPADILFIMDSSYSTEKHFNDSKASVTAIVNKLSIGTDDFLVACMTYSFDVTVEFSFDKFTDKASVITAINRLTNKGGSSYLDKALTKSKQMLSFASTYGARKSVRKYIIIISDGLSTLRKNAIDDAWQLKSQGVRVVAIGNGEQVEQKELLNLATVKQYVFPAGRENDVTNAILMETVNSSCTDCSIHKMTDILFLVDVSLHQTSLQLTLDALRDLEQKVLDFNSDTQVGMATFDLTVQSKFPFNFYTKRDDILDNSQIGIATTNVTSNISAALAFARHTGFTGARADARKMLVVFSNEGWTDLDDVRQHRQALNMDNVTVGFITVGRYADLASTYSVSEKPSHVYYIESHADFDRFEALVAQTTHAECPNDIFDVRQ
ncbi:collagen alpha-5(VI) chain-like [Argopecten irradians]|uniref:collagen alpha-5(VI) chain-like n=1 Tax=Argopecten irradians TaxID=31199 RepID=UPI00370FB0AC